MLRILLRVSKPLTFVFSILLYILGVGIARYLGTLLDVSLLLLGLSWVVIIQLGALFLIEYHSMLVEADVPIYQESVEDEQADIENRLSPHAVFAVAATCLTAVASVTVLLIRLLGWRPDIFLLMLLIFLGAFFYAAPPRRLAFSGYGELIVIVVLANFVPAYAFLLQSAESLRLVSMSTFPLVALCLALAIEIEFSTYADDLKQIRSTLLIHMGWERGVLLHNILILMAFVLFGLAAVMGMPFFIVWPTFLLIPVGIWQVLTMNRIASGAKPNWRSLVLGGQLLMGVAAYLVTYGFWIH